MVVQQPKGEVYLARSDSVRVKDLHLRFLEPFYAFLPPTATLFLTCNNVILGVQTGYCRSFL